MARNLDLTALRSFVAVADAGGVTRAAGFLNLTQSAVSMQLKRLEQSLGISLMDRSARTIALTPMGEQMLSYARRMLELNDEVYGKLTANAYEGEITLGVPHDIIYPAIPQVLQRFAAAYPRLRVKLVASSTNLLKAQFARGEVDLILTTEPEGTAGHTTLTTRKLVWIGAPNGTAGRARPLRLAFSNVCLFRTIAQRTLDSAGIGWEMAMEGDGDTAIMATVSADLAVHASLEGTEPADLTVIPASAGLPKLGELNINMYRGDPGAGPAMADLVDMVTAAYRVRHPVLAEVKSA
ncbi:LysR family transcriptional regulator [Yoonia sp. MH D7]